MTIAAVISLLILLLLTIFQLALICGAPLGRFAWGGQHNILPLRLRIGSAISIIIYIVFASFASSKAGLWVPISDETLLNAGLWIIVVYSVFGILLNAISRSRPERYLMTPVAAILAICFLVMALM